VLLAIDYWVNERQTEKGRIYFLAALTLALASLGSFFIGYKAQPAADCFSFGLQSPTDYAWYVALMFAPLFGVHGIGVLPTTLGALGVCALLAALVSSAKALLRTEDAQWSRHAAIAILTSYCLLFCLGTAYGRLCLGIGYAQSSRYVIYLNLGLLGLYFSLLTVPNTIARNTLIATFGVCLLIAMASGEQMRPIMAAFHDTKQRWKSCYLALGDIEECNRYATVYPWDPTTTHLREKLDFLKRTRQNLFADSN